jgi:hypothetical protein
VGRGGWETKKVCLKGSSYGVKTRDEDVSIDFICRILPMTQHLLNLSTELRNGMEVAGSHLGRVIIF